MNSNGASLERRSKRPSTRPAIEIYRPPGLRCNDESTNTKPIPTAGAKQLKKDIVKIHNEDRENNNDLKSKCVTNTLNGCTRKITDDAMLQEKNHDIAPLQRADSALSSESAASSQASSKSLNSRRKLSENLLPNSKEQHLKRVGSRSSQALQQVENSVIQGNHKAVNGRTVSHKNAHKDQSKKKQLSTKEVEELASGLRKLNLNHQSSLIEKFITGNFEGDEIGRAVGQTLVHFSIEENRQAGKTVARVAAQLLEINAASDVYQGIITALMHYFECRGRLRTDHFRVWIIFLNFVSDIYGSLGYIYEGELVELVFRIFHYLLKPPILDTLKIEELESLISCLLSVGYDLERQCPEQLAILKDLVRDAFIEVQEPWARKMILLLLELGASGWKLPAEANEYYFQQTSS